MLRKLHHIADSEDNGKTLSEILKHRFGVSEMLLRRMKRIENGILLNGRSVYTIDVASVGDEIEVILEPEEKSSPGVVPTKGELTILFENEDVLIIDKPAEIAVHPSHGHFDTSLGNIVMWYYVSRGENFVFRPINRLDRGVSGVMAVAKNAYTHTFAARLLHSGKFYREYLAVCEGVFLNRRGEVNAPIGRRDGSVIEREVRKDGDCAVTRYEVLEEHNGKSLVRVTPLTGRTHQIRVHMAHLGHPLIGDFLYGSEHPELSGRCALHSHRLHMELPFGGGEIDISSPLPENLEKIFRK